MVGTRKTPGRRSTTATLPESPGSEGDDELQPHTADTAGPVVCKFHTWPGISKCSLFRNLVVLCHLFQIAMPPARIYPVLLIYTRLIQPSVHHLHLRLLIRDQLPPLLSWTWTVFPIFDTSGANVCMLRTSIDLIRSFRGRLLMGLG